MKKLKSLLISACALVLCLSVGGAVKSIVKADGSSESSTFTMVNGAAVYVSSDEARTGLKFSATISKSEYNTLVDGGATFGFVIMPQNYLSYLPEGETLSAKHFGTCGGSYVVFCLNGAEHECSGEAHQVAYTETPQVFENGNLVTISASLVDIQQSNIPRTFVGVAYVRTEGKLALAANCGAEGYERSMLYVAQRAVEDKDLNSAKLIKTYFEPLAGKEIPYNVKYLLDGNESSAVTVQEKATFSGTGLTYAEPAGYDWGSDTTAYRVIDSTKRVVYNELKTTVVVNYTTSVSNTVTADRQQLVVSGGTGSIVLDGASEISGSITSIKCGEEDLGTDISKLDLTKLESVAHGECDITVTTNDSRKITVPVLLVTDVITDWNTLLHSVQYHSGNKGANVGEGKYYVLGSDIVGSGINSHTVDETSYTNAYYYEGYELNNFVGFVGTLDGAGHTITNVKIDAVGIFAMMHDATVKNLDIEISDWTDSNGTIFGYWMKDVTVENVNIDIKKISNTLNAALIAADQTANCKFKDFTVNAKGIALNKIFWNLSTPTYSNVKIYAKDYQIFKKDDNLTPWNQSIKFYKDTQNIELTGDTISVDMPTAWKNSGYSTYQVTINGKMLTKGQDKTNSVVFGGSYNFYALDLTKLDVAEILNAVNNIPGDYEIKVTFAKKDWTYGYDGYSIPVHFDIPESTGTAE